MPGWRLRALVVALFDQATAERILFPAIADLQHEVAEAGVHSRGARAAIRLRSYLAFWRALGACSFTRRSPSEGASWLRVLAGGAAVLVVMTVAMMYSPLSRTRGLNLGSLAVLLLPQALALSIPCSVLGAGFVGPQISGRVIGAHISILRATLAYSAVAAVASSVVMVWALPAANQEYRVRAYRILWTPAYLTPRNIAPPKGYPEMTIRELRESRRRAVLQARWAVAEEATYYAHLKGALPAASIAFGLVGIGLAPRRRIRRYALAGACAAAFITPLVYDLWLEWQLRVVRTMVVPAWFGAWAPPALCSALALVVSWWRFTRPEAQLSLRTQNFER